MVTQVINVNYNNDLVGAVSFDTDTGFGAFEYDSKFIRKGIELSPITMPLSQQIYSFPALSYATFRGLPGLVADSLPDDFGNAVLNAWVASQGKAPEAITPLQRLQYTGKRGMGALEYAPATRLKSLNASEKIEIESLVSIAQEILDSREDFAASLSQPDKEDREAMMSLLSVGMSAGGARPKAVLAFNEGFTQVRSGQVKVPDGFTHYLMKFDGVNESNKNQETFGDPQGYGAMEYVYYLMAKQCGINIMQPGSYSYAELFAVARKLRVSAKDAEELLRRLVFNIVARNHDDHSKNFAFLLIDNKWQLSPAYDLAYSYKPGSKWVNSHWMSLNGKRDNFTREDIYSLEKLVPSFTKPKINKIINKTIEHVANWQMLAKENAVPAFLIKEIDANLHLSI